MSDRHARTAVWTDALGAKYERGINYLGDALRSCPEELWGASLWVVRDMTVEEGIGADLPPEERVQLYSALWNVAYHTIFHLDFYLSRGELPFDTPRPFRSGEHGAAQLPWRVYTKDELLGYLEHCRTKAHRVISSLTDDDAATMALTWRRGHSQRFADLLLDNLVHLYEHGSQIRTYVNERVLSTGGNDGTC